MAASWQSGSLPTQPSISASTRRGEPLALLLFDLIDLAGINDRFGHAAGDELLVDVAGRLAAQGRAGDEVARVGGDEFLVLLDPVEGDAPALEAAAK